MIQQNKQGQSRIMSGAKMMGIWNIVMGNKSLIGNSSIRRKLANMIALSLTLNNLLTFNN